MRFAVILAVLALIGVAGVWLFAGRQLVLLLDCIRGGTRGYSARTGRHMRRGVRSLIHR
jgi:hypothetical protein